MDLIKKLTGKNPSEYEIVAKSLVDNSDVELFAKLVKQDDFLFDFIKKFDIMLFVKGKVSEMLMFRDFQQFII